MLVMNSPQGIRVSVILNLSQNTYNFLNSYTYTYDTCDNRNLPRQGCGFSGHKLAKYTYVCICIDVKNGRKWSFCLTRNVKKDED